jgi:hypothetical protein
VNFPTHLIQCGGDSYNFAMTGVPYHLAWAWTCLITASPQILKPRTAKVVQPASVSTMATHFSMEDYCIRPCVKEYSIAHMLLKEDLGRGSSYDGRKFRVMKWQIVTPKQKTWITTCNDHRCGKEIVEFVFHQSTMI